MFMMITMIVGVARICQSTNFEMVRQIFTNMCPMRRCPILLEDDSWLPVLQFGDGVCKHTFT